MTVSTTLRKAGPFTGNDVTTVFPFAFKVFSTADVMVVVNLAGVESTLVLGVDYGVTLNVDQDGTPGGSVNTTTPLPHTETLVITSNVAATQLTLITNAGGFFPKVFNAVFDKAVILVQQLAEKISRAVTIPITASGVLSLQIPVLASGVLQWKADGTALQAVTLPDLSLSLALPNQATHNGHPLFSNGAAALWRAITTDDVAGLGTALNYLNAGIGLNNLKINTLTAQATSLQDQISSTRNFAIAAAIVF